MRKKDGKDLLFYLIEFEKKADTAKFLKAACLDAEPDLSIDRPKLEHSYIDSRASQAIRVSHESIKNNSTDQGLNKRDREKEEFAVLQHLENSTQILFREIDELFSDILASLTERNKQDWLTFTTSISPISKSIPDCPDKEEIASKISRVKSLISEIEVADPPPQNQNLLDEFYWYRFEDGIGWFSKHYKALITSIEIKGLLRDAKKAKHIYDVEQEKHKEEQKKKADEDALKKRRFTIRVSIAVFFGVLSVLFVFVKG